MRPPLAEEQGQIAEELSGLRAAAGIEGPAANLSTNLPPFEAKGKTMHTPAVKGALVATALAVLLSGATATTGRHSANAAKERSGGRAVAHRAGGKRISTTGLRRPVAVNLPTGDYDAAEPTLGVSNGSVFYVAADIDDPEGPNQVRVLRSDSGGRTWKDVSPQLGSRRRHVITLDPMIHLDERAGRLFTIDLTVACSYLSFSDDADNDEGATWTTNPLACGRPINDHQTLFTGPPASSPTVGYENIVYYCWNDVASSSCSKSLDGGITWHPTGSPAFAGLDPTNQSEGFFGVTGFCGGLHGHGVVGDDGAVYLPRELCREPWLAISPDEGRTWERVRVANKGVHGLGAGASNPSVAVDNKNNLYYTWVAANRLPYLAYSRNGGKKWSKPLMIGRPGVKEANFPTLDAVAPGKVAIAYMGSKNSPYPRCKQECESSDYGPVTWNAYITMTANLFSRNPVFYTGTINHPTNPIKRQRCGPGRCGRVFDFIDVEIGPDGTPWAAFVDACVGTCLKDRDPNDKAFPVSAGDEGFVGRLVRGPRLSPRRGRSSPSRHFR